jgi:hypothetical protein
LIDLHHGPPVVVVWSPRGCIKQVIKITRLMARFDAFKRLD